LGGDDFDQLIIDDCIKVLKLGDLTPTQIQGTVITAPIKSPPNDFSARSLSEVRIVAEISTADKFRVKRGYTLCTT
jgi:hypothetical protein